MYIIATYTKINSTLSIDLLNCQGRIFTTTSTLFVLFLLTGLLDNLCLVGCSMEQATG